MTAEQQLIEAWRKLPEAKQQEVIDFFQLLEKRCDSKENRESNSAPSQLGVSQLGEKLQGIRDRIVASGTPLLTPEEIEQEVLERRGEYQG